ncbi:MAG TPA: SDR family oxidoreductase [Acidimicrobiales bacterium]|jgi:nucleoside-diphosphate-sugar epimerase
MRVFVTGASGHVGSALLPDLIAAGHQVIGLARSDDSTAALRAAGADVHRGDLSDPASLREGAAKADGVIHLAYNHDFNDLAAAAALDIAAIEAMGDALAGSDKPLLMTSGTLLLAMVAPGRLGTEDDGPKVGEYPNPRMECEVAALALVERGVRVSVVRLSPTVHSDLDHHGFIPLLIENARSKGVAGYVGDGSNRWPAVHTRDAARLYRLGLESAPAGSRLHGVGDEGVPYRLIAETIGSQLGIPAASIAAEDAVDHFGFLGFLVGIDNPTSNTATRELVGWQPEHPGLIDDMKEGHYFASATR